jgi:hypothetical protein
MLGRGQERQRSKLQSAALALLFVVQAVLGTGHFTIHHAFSCGGQRDSTGAALSVVCSTGPAAQLDRALHSAIPCAACQAVRDLGHGLVLFGEAASNWFPGAWVLAYPPFLAFSSGAVARRASRAPPRV